MSFFELCVKRERRRFENICESEKLASRGILVAYADEIDSTNAEARRFAMGGRCDVPVLFVAKKQTAGRGRLGRSFYSPADTGLYMTLLLPIGDLFSSTVGLTSAAAVAVLRGTDHLTGGRTQIKWVNDILLGGKKICGILAESFLENGRSYAAIGIGVNVRTEDFPEDIRQTAGSIGGIRADRADICERIVCELYDLCMGLERADRSFMEEYKARSAVLGKRVSFGSGEDMREGIAADIDGDGALLVTLDDGNRVTLNSGEITLRLK